MTAAAPDRLARPGERVADAVNPIVVKELRQGLRTRVFWVFFTLMLVSCLGIALVAFAVHEGVGDRTGTGAFIATFVALGLVQFFVIPYAAYRSMAREAEDETWALLTLTGLGPRRILAGKVTSAVLQGGLYASAATPFLLFAYFLNGVDLPTIGLAVGAAVAWQVFLVAAAVSVATLAESRVVRALLHFVLLGGLFQATVTGVFAAAGLGELARKATWDATFWLVAAAVLFALVSTGGLLFQAAAARLSLVTEDYARGPRLAYLAQVVGAAAFVLALYLVARDAEVLVAGSVAHSAYTALAGLFVVSDRDGMAKVHWLSGRRYALLSPGALRGFLLVVGLHVLVTAALLSPWGLDAPTRTDERAVALAAPAYALLLLSLASLLARWIPHPPSLAPALVRLTFLVLVVVLSAGPPLVGAMVGRADDAMLNVFNPVVGLINLGDVADGDWSQVLLLWSAATGATVAAALQLRARDGEWRA